jgi:hypothetical protein
MSKDAGFASISPNHVLAGPRLRPKHESGGESVGSMSHQKCPRSSVRKTEGIILVVKQVRVAVYPRARCAATNVHLTPLALTRSVSGRPRLRQARFPDSRLERAPHSLPHL